MKFAKEFVRFKKGVKGYRGFLEMYEASERFKFRFAVYSYIAMVSILSYYGHDIHLFL